MALVVLTVPPPAEPLVRHLEDRIPTPDPMPKEIRGIAVLGGAEDPALSGGPDFGFAPPSKPALLSLALREWLGLAVYRMTGRTDKLYPAPI